MVEKYTKSKTLYYDLSDELLIEAYKKALTLNLDETFIEKLKDEIKYRELSKYIVP